MLISIIFVRLNFSFFNKGIRVKYWFILLLALSVKVNAKLAVSLSYDDALASQLDIALPALNKYQIKASFYVVPNSPVFQSRIEEWRSVALQGHELGNHTLFHACQASKPDREWVEVNNDLDKKSVSSVVNEIKIANTLLQALDGKRDRTFTPPCFDIYAGGQNFLPKVEQMFTAIKGQEGHDMASLFAPNNHTANDIIEFIESQPKHIKVVNILMHGVGGDYLSISAQEHDKLLQYLANNTSKLKVDTYLNIMKYLESSR